MIRKASGDLPSARGDALYGFFNSVIKTVPSGK
jgi:hypothetical protein